MFGPDHGRLAGCDGHRWRAGGRVEGGDELFDRLVAVYGALGRRSLEHVVDGNGEIASRRANRWDRIVQLTLQQRCLIGFIGERETTHERLVDGDRQTMHVGRGPDGFTTQLLWRGVGGGARRQRRLRICQLGFGEGDPEVGQIRVAIIVEQDVGGLHVAMDHTGTMGNCER